MHCFLHKEHYIGSCLLLVFIYNHLTQFLDNTSDSNLQKIYLFLPFTTNRPLKSLDTEYTYKSLPCKACCMYWACLP